MPYKFETSKVKLPRCKDRRVIITPELKDDILSRLANRESKHSITRETGVSRRSIQFIANPELYEIVKAQHKERRKDGRYKPDKKTWATTMREHRKYKQSILAPLTPTLCPPQK